MFTIRLNGAAAFSAQNAMSSSKFRSKAAVLMCIEPAMQVGLHWLWSVLVWSVTDVGCVHIHQPSVHALCVLAHDFSIYVYSLQI